MKVNELMKEFGSDIYYTPDFYDLLETHIPYIRKSNNVYIKYVAMADGYVYNGDLYGYLNSIKISPKLHWLVMRLNNMFSASEFGPNTKRLLIPSIAILDRIHQVEISDVDSLEF